MKTQKLLIEELREDYQRKLIYYDCVIEIHNDLLKKLPEGEKLKLMSVIAEIQSQRDVDSKMIKKLSTKLKQK